MFLRVVGVQSFFSSRYLQYPSVAVTLWRIVLREELMSCCFMYTLTVDAVKGITCDAGCFIWCLMAVASASAATF